jgi:tRNA A37 threonylcarbamoyladenosine biosynthesis protein TsaE
MNDPKAVVAVEWSDIVKHVLPEQRVTVKLELIGESSRQLQFTYPEALAYLIPKDTK